MTDKSSVSMTMTTAVAVSVAVSVAMSVRVGVRMASRADSGVLLKLLDSSSMKTPGVTPSRLDAGMGQQFYHSLKILLSTLR